MIPAEVEWCAELLDALDAPADAALREALAHVHERFRDYFARLDRATRTLHELAPGRTPFALLDEECIREKVGAGIPFPERGGVFAGYPPDDETAIRELERMRSEGVRLIAIWWTCFWVLDHYRGFRLHLEQSYRCVARDESLVVYDLTSA